MPIGKQIAAPNSKRYMRGRSSLATRQFRANQTPPRSSINITTGMSTASGKKPISKGDMTIAPPKPLKRRNNPPKVAEIANRAIANQSNEFN